MSTSKLTLAAVRNTVGLMIYVGLVVAVMSNSERAFAGKPEYLMGIAILMLFVLSALISGLLVLGQPVWLFLQGKKAEALKLLGLTVAAMAAATLILLAVLAL